MIDVLDQALVALQAALFAREVHFPEHPAVIEQERLAHELLREMLETQRELRIMAFDDRVVYDNEILPSSGSLVEGLFQRLRMRGVECVTITKGVAAEELSKVLEQLGQAIEDETLIEPTARIRFGYIKGTVSGDGAMPSPGQFAIALRPRKQAGLLQQVWRGLRESEDCNTEMLERVVADICTAVAATGGAIIPLATLKHHDEYTFVHTINVAILSAALAEATGIPPDTVHDVTIAALLHDIGKRSVPKRVLNKKAGLSDSERRIVERHPTEGARLLFEADNVPALAPIVAYEHHIYLDGTGYPTVAPGWRISLASQIVQIADIFDALRTNRPYRAALSVEKSTEILRDDAGKRYDRDLLELFVRRVAMQTDRELKVMMDDRDGDGRLAA
jgi:putative nucleotidyltransferase with HDIG domain